MANNRYASSHHHLKQARGNVEEQTLRINTAYVRCPKTDEEARTELKAIGQEMIKLDLRIETLQKSLEKKVADAELEVKDKPDEHARGGKTPFGQGKR